jgi:DNA polymerase/3'-5' exonuclease PolX
MKIKRPYSEMIVLAEKIKFLLEPHCERICIAGSIRRKKPEVGDVEIVLIPKPFETGLFATGIAEVMLDWKIIRGDLDKHCKYTSRLVEGVQVDIFFCEHENWGNTLAVRTGSGEYSKNVLANGWVKAGYFSKENYLYKYGCEQKIILREEKDLFSLIGTPFIEPENRNII